MEEEDKIHKFLTKLSDAYADIAIDPATRQRWTSYQTLKDYALTYAAAQASRPSPRKRIPYPAGALGRAADLAQGALKKQRTDDGWQTAGGKRRQSGNANGAGSSHGPRPHGRTNHPSFENYYNAANPPVLFSRHKQLVSWCHGNDICICCYSKYDSHTKQQHRQFCTATPATGYPAGYQFNPRGKQQ